MQKADDFASGVLNAFVQGGIYSVIGFADEGGNLVASLSDDVQRLILAGTVDHNMLYVRPVLTGNRVQTVAKGSG